MGWKICCFNTRGKNIIMIFKELGVKWPITMSMISEKDLSLPNLEQVLNELEN